MRGDIDLTITIHKFDREVRPAHSGQRVRDHADGPVHLAVMEGLATVRGAKVLEE